MEMKQLDAVGLVLLYHEAFPIVFWIIDIDTFHDIRILKKADGRYMWQASLENVDNQFCHGKLFGIPITVVPRRKHQTNRERCLQLETHFPNGKTEITKY